MPFFTRNWFGFAFLSLAAQVASYAAVTMGPAQTFNITEVGLSNATVATFTSNNGPAANFTGTLSWGDGSTQTITVSGGPGSFTVSGSHMYNEGSYVMTVTVKDNTDQMSGMVTNQVVVVDAPLAAFPSNPLQMFNGSGSSAGPSLANFEAAIGGVNNAGNPSQSGGFRTINWDAVKLDGTDFNGLSMKP